MIIDVLVCRMDGTQTLEQREVPDDWFPMREDEESESVPEET
ncbi:MAG: hypothetical protein Q3X94_08525 [Oscillospiraceae bacterium]|nr:hypothetical protein [Oscillospiraceae bacterium]